MKNWIIAAALLLGLGLYIQSEIRAYKVAAVKTIREIRDQDQCVGKPVSGDWVDRIHAEKPEGYQLVFEIRDRGAEKKTQRYQARLLQIRPDGRAYDTVFDINGACVRSEQPDLPSLKKAIFNMLPFKTSVSEKNFKDMENRFRLNPGSTVILRVSIDH